MGALIIRARAIQTKEIHRCNINIRFVEVVDYMNPSCGPIAIVIIGKITDNVQPVTLCAEVWTISQPMTDCLITEF